MTLLSLSCAAQIITTVAGNGQMGFSGDGGSATAASLSTPQGLVVDLIGTMYIADTGNHRVRRVNAAGTISTLAGTGTAGDTSSTLNTPVAVTIDSAGNIYVADNGNRVRRIRGDGVIVAFAGTGDFGNSGDGGPAVNATFQEVIALTADSAGNVYIVDSGSNVVRRVNSSGVISTVAGSGRSGFAGDGGPATSALLNGPQGIAVDSAGNLYIADQGNHRVRRVSSSGIITTVAGTGADGFSGDGGPAAAATFSSPSDVAVDRQGNLFIADTGNLRIRRVNASGTITTYAGGGFEFPGDGSPATNVILFVVLRISTDSSGNLYLIDLGQNKVRKITPAGGGSGVSFSVTPQILAFSANSGTTVVAPQQLAVSSNTTGLAFTASATTSIGGGWLSVAPASGSTPGNLAVSVSPANLPGGIYSGAVNVTSPTATPATVSVPVVLTVTAVAQLAISPTVMIFEAVAGFGNPPAQNLSIRNIGTGTLSYTVTTGPTNPWLAVSSTSGSATPASPGAVQVTANVAGLAPGAHSGTITVQSGTQSQTVLVTLIITQPAQTILVSRSGLLFTGVAGGGVLPAQSFGVLNAGRNVLSWTATASTLGGGNWLSVSPASGSSDAASTTVPQVEVRVDSTGLAAGAYTGTVQVSSTAAVNSPQTVTVFLTVLPAGGNPGVQVQPTGLIFVSSAAQTVSLGKAAPGNLLFNAAAATASGGNWLTVTPSSGTLSAGTQQTLNVQAATGALAAGIYQGTVTLTFGDASSQVVNALLVVPSPTEASKVPGAAACTPAQLVTVVRSIGANFNSPANWPTNIEALVVDNCGTARADATVIASFSNGDPPLVLVSLKNGTYSGTWRPLTQAAAVTVRVRATVASLTAAEAAVQGQVAANASAPVLFPGGIVNAASFAAGSPLSPGSIVSLFGSRMAATGAAAQVPLPTTLGNTTLRVGETLVPLYVSTDGQINAQIPYELTAPANYQMVLRTPSQITVPESFNLSLTRPGIFTTNQQGTGQGVVLNTSQQVVDSTNPAGAGDVLVIYTTGLGATNPVVASGVAAPSAEPLARVTNTVTVTVGGQNATVQFAGLTPGFVGLYQVNVQIPAGIAPGPAVNVVLTQRSVPSNTVTISVR